MDTTHCRHVGLVRFVAFWTHFVQEFLQAEQMAEQPVQELSSRVQGLTATLVTQGAMGMIPMFELGKTTTLKEWFQAIDKFSALTGVKEDDLINLAWTRCTGTVSDFIARAREETPKDTWTQIKTKLAHCFGEPMDTQHAYSRVRWCRQQRNETVHQYGERLLKLAKEAYGDKMTTEPTKTLIDGELVGIFVDGLISGSMQEKVYRADPKSVPQALQVAHQEDLVRKRFAGSRPPNPPYGHNRKEEPMEVDHTRPQRFQHHSSARQELRQRQQGARPDMRRRDRPQGNAPQPPPKRCWNCGRTGHLLANCPSNGPAQ